MCTIMDWEMFYTESKNDENKIDQISINEHDERYILELDADESVLDLEDEVNDLINYSVYVSRFVFDMLVNAIKQTNFKVLED